MNLVLIAYSVAAAAYFLLTALLIVSRRFVWPFGYLLAMAMMMSAWAGLLLWSAQSDMQLATMLGADALHAFALLLFLGQIIQRGEGATWQRAFAYGPWLIPFTAGLLYFSGVYSSSGSLELAIYLILGLSLAGLLAAEQIYRNAGVMKRKVASLIALAFGMIFVFDMFVYSNALMGLVINAELWAVRGFVNAAAVPIILLALKRDPDWQSGFFVSRQVIFYSTSLIGVGIYLILVAFGGILLQTLGGTWGNALKVVFLLSGIILLAWVVFSRPLRRRFKVFLATHFYANRYDYREEWLKLIRRLAQDSQRAPMPVLCLEALADILDSDGGLLWLLDAENDQNYAVAASFGVLGFKNQLSKSHALIQFMSETGWVVDGQEAVRDPDHYSRALTGVADLVSADVLFVPLVLDDQLIGVVCLNRPVGMHDLNFEDHDLLRTVGRQVAVFLDQSRVQEQLTHARQFEVFNRFSAFVMHDLKNIVAQQSLVVENAKKHKANPEFIEDAIGTIENSVKRMNRLLEQLQTGRTGSTIRTIDVGGVVAEVCQHVADRSPQPNYHKSAEVIRFPLFGDSEKLRTAVHHLLRNAQDATDKDGQVEVVLSALMSDGDSEGRPSKCELTISDTGSGMSAAFIAQHLFEPFYSTKGAQGMGIGVYQARDYIVSLGGTLDVESELGVGTTFTIQLPLTHSLHKSVAAEQAS